jgi:hypothetical protein
MNGSLRTSFIAIEKSLGFANITLPRYRAKLLDKGLSLTNHNETLSRINPHYIRAERFAGSMKAHPQSDDLMTNLCGLRNRATS